VEKTRYGETTKTGSTTTNLEDLIAELKAKYPQHNIDYEMDRCRQYYAGRAIKLKRSILIGWMRRAELPFKRPKKQVTSKHQKPTPAWDDNLGKQIAKSIREFRKTLSKS
jgi:hypothetical protein